MILFCWIQFKLFQEIPKTTFCRFGFLSFVSFKQIGCKTKHTIGEDNRAGYWWDDYRYLGTRCVARPRYSMVKTRGGRTKRGRRKRKEETGREQSSERGRTKGGRRKRKEETGREQSSERRAESAGRRKNLIRLLFKCSTSMSDHDTVCLKSRKQPFADLAFLFVPGARPSTL